ncbi:MAG: hypothetical protein HY735_03380 [Verrucomicrobia bacterium]|nr:hypothetical protein [Verrucomicrobiota bacterium]
MKNRIVRQGLRFLEKGGERLLVVAFCGNNRPPEFVEFQQKVFAHFNIPINHLFADFPNCSHGEGIDRFVATINDGCDYLLLFDTDALPLRRDFIDIAYDKIRDKRTVFGVAQQSNHIAVNGTVNHVYAGPCAFAISRKMYIGLGRPTFAETPRSDCAEEITWRAEELGYTICLMFPSHVHEKRWRLGNGHQFGIGTTYGDCVFHAFAQAEEESKQLFLQKCEEILNRSASRNGKNLAHRCAETSILKP